jgi:hypothetical protein
MEAMRRGLLPAVVLALGVSGGAVLSGCGSQTKTVSVAPSPPTPQTSATTVGGPSTTTAPVRTTPVQTTPAQTTAGGGTPGPTSTRSAPEPAFTRQGANTEALSAATAVLRAKGFTATNTADYHPNQTLRVLVGRRTGSGDGYGQQAFFFVNGRYIGTDSSQPSATLRVLGQGDTEVTLAYPLYRKNDPLCCPGAGQARVRFQLDNGRLVPLDPIPPASSQSAVSRH